MGIFFDTLVNSCSEDVIWGVFVLYPYSVTQICRVCAKLFMKSLTAGGK